MLISGSFAWPAARLMAMSKFLKSVLESILQSDIDELAAAVENFSS